MRRRGWGMLALWLWLSAIQASSQDQAPVSGMGVTRTVAQLMASPQASPTGKSLRPRRIPARSKIFSRPSISSKSALKPGIRSGRSCRKPRGRSSPATARWRPA